MYDEELSEDFKREYFEMNLKAAKIGFVESMRKVAGAYFNGYGVEKNFDAAIKWYEKAAEFGNINAAKNLVMMYASDKKKSLYWLNKVLEMEAEKVENGFLGVAAKEGGHTNV